MAQAVRDSGETVDPNDPGVGACGPLGQNQWCQTVVDGAAFTTQWAAFSTWTQTGAAFVNPPGTFTAGAVAGPLTVQLKTGTVVTPALADTPVTLTTSSLKGQFAASATGPWTPTLTLTIPAGASSVSFYYQDTAAGTPTISATLAGQPRRRRWKRSSRAAPATLQVQPRSVTVVGGKKQTFSARVADQYGNPSTAPVAWSLAPASLGTLVAATGASTTFTASRTAAGRGRLTVRVGRLTASVAVKVVRPPARIGGTLTRAHRRPSGGDRRGSSAARCARRASPVSLVVRHGSSLIAHVTGRTDAHGRFTWRSEHPLPAGRYAVKAAIR